MGIVQLDEWGDERVMTMSKRYALYALVLLAAGCGVKPPIEPRMDPNLPAHYSFASEDLRSKTAIGLANQRRVNGILYVTVPVRSASNYDLYVDYRITFLNSEGAVIYQGPWESKTLVRNVFEEITFNSPDANAADWRMDLRYSQ